MCSQPQQAPSPPVGSGPLTSTYLSARGTPGSGTAAGSSREEVGLGRGTSGEAIMAVVRGGHVSERSSVLLPSSFFPL